jgi:S1-C subfamily serine protease
MSNDFDFFNEEAKGKKRTPPRREPERVESVRPPLAEPEDLEYLPLDEEPVEEARPARRVERSAPPPRSRRPRGDDDYDRDEAPPKKKGLSPLILLAIAGGALLVVGAGVLILVFAREKDPERKEKEKAKAVASAAAGPPPAAPAKKDVFDVASPTPETVAKVKNATVLIRVLFNNGKGASGSGFVEKSSGLVVTNAHVVGLKDKKTDGGPKIINLIVNSGLGEKEYPLGGELADVDEENDLALIRPFILEVGERHVVPEGLVVAKNPSLTELQSLTVVGYPLGTEIGAEVSVRPTKITSFRRDSGGKLKLIQVEGGMTHGNSGGPVVDVRGQVVGVAVSGIKDETINFAVPCEKVVELLAHRKR